MNPNLEIQKVYDEQIKPLKDEIERLKIDKAKAEAELERLRLQLKISALSKEGDYPDVIPKHLKGHF